MTKPKLPDHFPGNPQLKAAGVKISFNKEQQAEYLRCAMDCQYFIETYVKIVNLDDGIVNFKLYPYQKRIVKTIVKNNHVLVKTGRQQGKALDIETPILTTSGFKKLKDIKTGDKIYGPDGKSTKVTFITPIMYDHKCYKVTFDNNDTIIADADHLWTVYNPKWSKNKSKTLTTEELIPRCKHESKVYIPFTKPVEYESKNLLIDPYVLGLWLGDSNGLKYHMNDLNTLGVLKNKHIPDEYMFSNYEQRLSLLQGLMNTDGSVTNDGNYEFYQKSESLIDQVRILLASLGIKSRKTSKRVNGEVYWIINFCTSIHEKFNPKNTRLYIKSIEPVESRPVRCLQVDNDNHLFLAGSTLIPTHNTTTVMGVYLWLLLFNSKYTIAILANKESQAKEILERLKFSYTQLPFWLQQGIVEWNKNSIKCDNGSSVFAAATGSDSIRGRSVNCIEGSSEITLRNKKTGEIKTLSIEEAYQLPGMQVYVNNKQETKIDYKCIIS